MMDMLWKDCKEQKFWRPGNVDYQKVLTSKNPLGFKSTRKRERRASRSSSSSSTVKTASPSAKKRSRTGSKSSSSSSSNVSKKPILDADDADPIELLHQLHSEVEQLKKIVETLTQTQEILIDKVIKNEHSIPMIHLP
eukprot:CAMPEP_0201552816 /NCGR_PEP_ID=MMETSP0173_2-20130828/18200_1 /ASSEMBLY_ACC=CAM_ASM_000268 /TAXON_ID=218659 /ORGANISM="Vexillifera sp., Strain DIVA3 564/2" /LENGTH=137 /DNA_ID=CAMNT_0047963369 /DNA_START=272 /DNA_END=681 /DNA_ORIENTATION=-